MFIVHTTVLCFKNIFQTLAVNHLSDITTNVIIINWMTNEPTDSILVMLRCSYMTSDAP